MTVYLRPLASVSWTRSPGWNALTRRPLSSVLATRDVLTAKHALRHAVLAYQQEMGRGHAAQLLGDLGRAVGEQHDGVRSDRLGGAAGGRLRRVPGERRRGVRVEDALGDPIGTDQDDLSAGRRPQREL